MPVGDTKIIIAWKSKGLSVESITLPPRSDNSLASKLKWIRNSKIVVGFKTSCLKQDKVTFSHNNVIN